MKEIEKAHSQLVEFGDHIVCKLMLLNKAEAFKSCGGGLKSDLSNLREFFNTLIEIIRKGTAVLNLQNTPKPLAPPLSALNQSQNDPSDSSSSSSCQTEDRFNLFQSSSLDFLSCGKSQGNKTANPVLSFTVNHLVPKEKLNNFSKNPPSGLILNQNRLNMPPPTQTKGQNPFLMRPK